MRSIRVVMPLVCAALGVASASPARAEARLEPLVIEAAETLRGLEAELPEQARRALQSRTGIDTCARVKLGKRAAAITVDVELEDGRRATRVVPGREDVISKLEALLFVPDRHAAPQPPPQRVFDAATPTATPSGAVPRLLVRSQLCFAPRSVLRTFIGVDAEIGARGPSEADIPGGLPELPVWMVGLALGATLGTR